MLFKKILFYIGIYFAMVLVHFYLWDYWQIGFTNIFSRFYFFLTLLFFTALTVIIFIKKTYPDFVGFAFLGLILFKLSIVFIMINQMDFSRIPYYKVHFIIPYLFSLILETLFAVAVIQINNNKDKDTK